jgi:hypothetical protein
MAGQRTLLQRETTKGTAITSAMLELNALRMRPSWEGDREEVRGGTGKTVTGTVGTDEHSPWEIQEFRPCFNHLGLAAGSRVSAPTTTTPGGATTARQHVFSISPNAEDTFNSYTVVWGAANTAPVQAVYGHFNSLAMNIERGNVTFDTSFRSRAAQFGATIPGSGITAMPMVPMPGNMWDVYIDSAWADLGDTKYGGAYTANVDLGDKFDLDSPINSAIVSYEQPLEMEEQEHSFELAVRLGAVGLGLVGGMEAGTKHFFRLELVGGLIEPTINYICTIDFCAEIVSRSGITTAPNSAAVVLPLNLAMTPDPVTGKMFELTLVNSVTAY